MPKNPTRYAETAEVAANHRKKANRLLAFLMSLIISLPVLVNLAGVDGADPGAENRTLSPFPRVNSWRSAIEFTGDLAAWFSDHFGFRARLVQWYGEIRYFWLRVSPSATVAVGADGWLFYVDDYGLEDFANVQPFSATEIANWGDAIVRARDWMLARHGTYVFTIAPDKHVIYPEMFPTTVRRLRGFSRTDQLVAGASETAALVDIRPALVAAKAHERVYQLTDTHWNDLGAFAAYRQIIEAVRTQNPAVPPAWPRSDFEEIRRRITALDLAAMIGLKRVLTEDDLALVPKRPRHAVVVDPPDADPTAQLGELVMEIPGSSLPRAVIFRDSFASRLVPLLSEHFSRAVYLWQNDFVPAAIEREHADVVIQEIVGRHLYSFVPSPELVPE